MNRLTIFGGCGWKSMERYSKKQQIHDQSNPKNGALTRAKYLNIITFSETEYIRLVF